MMYLQRVRPATRPYYDNDRYSNSTGGIEDNRTRKILKTERRKTGSFRSELLQAASEAFKVCILVRRYLHSKLFLQ